MEKKKYYKAYDERKLYCHWCGYSGVFPMAEYRDGKYHKSIKVLCCCINAGIEAEKSPCLKQMADVIPYHEAKEMADGVNYVMVSRDEEFPKRTMVKQDAIPF